MAPKPGRWPPWNARSPNRRSRAGLPDADLRPLPGARRHRGGTHHHDGPAPEAAAPRQHRRRRPRRRGPRAAQRRHHPRRGRRDPSGPGLDADLLVAPLGDHDVLGVVVPWSGRRFQYTSRHTARPATRTVHAGGRTFGTWAAHGHGHGRRPRTITWNRAAASGRTGGAAAGLQFGGRWTDGTGATENALTVDGELTKIGQEPTWDYGNTDPLGTWRITADLTFTPVHNRRARADTGLLANRTGQRFGHFNGVIRPDTGPEVTVTGLPGWAEEARMRW